MADPTKDATPLAEQKYSALDGECHVIVARGAVAFRFGPYSGLEAGKILSQCVDEKIPCLLTWTCGREFDWDTARDLRGTPEVEEVVKP